MPKGLVVFGACMGLLVGYALVQISEKGGADAPSVTAGMPVGPTPPPLMLDEENTVQVFGEASPSVVYIQNIVERKNPFTMDVMQMEQGTGSGFVWDRDGHIVTNAHVLEGASRLSVTLLDQSVYEGVVVGVAPNQDLAVIKIDINANELSPLELGSSESLRVGQKVLAIGNPFGLDHTLTTGVVSALHREIKSVNGNEISGVIQTDAAIHPGNSGGPLLDSGGKLVGVNTAVLSASGDGMGIGFAVPVSNVIETIPQLIAYGQMKRASIGGVSFLNDAYVRRRGMGGAVVYRIVPGSVAEQMGLRGMRRGRLGTHFGDIVVSLGETRIRSAEELKRGLEQYRPGDEVNIGIVRAGVHRSIRMTLE